MPSDHSPAVVETLIAFSEFSNPERHAFLWWLNKYIYASPARRHQMVEQWQTGELLANEETSRLDLQS